MQVGGAGCARSRMLIGVSMLALLTGAAAAQTAGSQDARPTITVEESAAAPAPAYSSNDTVATGRSVISQDSVQARQTGNGDAMELLKVLPHVQFSRSQYSTDPTDIQDLRPSDISISGGRFYDNYFSIDGVGANSRFDTASSDASNPANFNEVAGAHAQSIWVDPALIGSITVEDSNISAEYGGFTGGVVDVQTKRPEARWAATATGNYTSDAMVHFRVSKADKAAFGDDLPEKVDFKKFRFGSTLNMPLTDRTRVLVGANRSRSEVTYYKAATYGGGASPRMSTSDNLLVKAEHDLREDLLLTAQVTYSPYTSEFSSDNRIDDTSRTHGGGLSSYLDLARTGSQDDWSLKLSYTQSDMDRDWAPIHYSWPSRSQRGSFCSSSNCSQGGFGDITQKQEDTGLKGQWTHRFDTAGTLRMGAEYTRVEAEKERPEDNYAYSRGVTGSNIVCNTSVACVTGDTVLTQYSIYKAYDINVALDSFNAWSEYNVTWNRFEVRAGLRYDYESFLGNHDVSPRLSVATALPWDTTLTLGANRYYSRSFLGYAMREKYPDNYVYQRTAAVSGGKQIYADDWTLSSYSKSTRYSDADLDTPYSDELTAAFTAPLPWGTLRLKGILRNNEDELTRSLTADSVTYVNPVTGRTTRFLDYKVSNDGHSRYRGLSAEWAGTWRNHSLAVNAAWSKTKSNSETYFDPADDQEAEDSFIYFNGQVTSEAEIISRNRRLDFNTPWTINAALTSRWWEDRITTVLQGRWKADFDRIQDSGANITVGGVSYDVWEQRHYKGWLDLGLNVQAKLVETDFGGLTAEARITNVLDALPNTETSASNPYQMGRSVWLGLTYTY